MELSEHYNNLWESSLREFRNGKFELDPLIDAESDDRFGVTLLARPGPEVSAAIQQFLHELKQVEPAQYYYPDSDLHLTVMSIISCYSGFRLDSIAAEEYLALLQEIASSTERFRIEFSGITASPSCILIQGFPLDNSLNNLRDEIRRKFKNSGLRQSIDARYTLRTAHCTVARFRSPATRPAALLEVLEKYRNFCFGTAEVAQAELVFNDWYQRSHAGKLLGLFDLKP